MMRPIGYRQITDKPLTTRISHSWFDGICCGNSEPTNHSHGQPELRRHTIPCQKRKRRIAAGESMVVATWANKPMITVHCYDCAARYQILNEADTPETPQPTPPQGLAAAITEKRGPIETPREARREVPQEAPTHQGKNSAQRPKRQAGRKKRGMA